MRKLFIFLFASMIAQATIFAQQVTNLELKKEYSVQNFKFTVQSVKIHKGSYPLGMFSGRPSNPKMDPSLDGVLGIELTVTNGSADAFSKLEIYLINEKGARNVKEDMMSMSGNGKMTILFNVPFAAKKLTLGIDKLQFNLERVL